MHLQYIPTTTFSTDRLLDMCWRVNRLCIREGDYALKYYGLIEEAVTGLTEKKNTADEKRRETDLALDLVLKKDGEVHDEIRNTFARCKIHDRSNGSPNLREVAFEDGNLSPVLEMPRDRKIEEARQIVNRIRGVAENGNAADIIQPLEATIAEEEQAQTEHAVQRRALRDAVTAELLERERLVKEYKNAYFRARLDLGTKKARHLFPIVLKRSDVGEEQSSEPEAPATPAV